MAKKAVAGYSKKREGRSYSKVIKMTKSSKGVYSFKEEMIPNEAVKDFLSKSE